MTHTRHNPEADAGFRAAGAEHGPRRKGLGRRMLARTLSGGVAVVAALTMPELSVGAGDLGGGEGYDDPPEPSSATGLDRAKRGPGAGKGPLTGVRYGALFEVSAAQSPTASLSRITNLDPATISLDETLAGPSQLAAPLSVGALARTTPAAGDQLDKAAAFAASVLTDFTAPPGLSAETAPPVVVPAAIPAKGSLDQAANYTASVIDTFVERSERRPAMSAVAPEFDGGARSLVGVAPTPTPAQAPAPSAPQDVVAPALAIPPATPPTAGVALQAVPAGLGDPLSAAPPPARIAAVETAPAAWAQPPAPVTYAAAPPPARIAAAATPPAPAPIAMASAAPSTAARSIAAPAPRPVTAPSASKPAPLAAAVAAVVPKPKPALTAPSSAAASPYQVDVASHLLTRVDGKTAGSVDFQQTPAGLKVRLGSIVEVLADRFDPAQIARIRASAAGNTYLSLADLQAQGVPISYDPVYDEFNVGTIDTRPKAGRKVHIDQITAPERNGASTAISQARR